METIARSTSTAFLEKLPSENEYYQSKDFVNAGFPEFLTERIISEMEERMIKSAEIAVSDWIDLDSGATSESWQKFLNSVKKDLKLPVHAAGEVITRSVETCLKLAVQPRKTVPALLFNGKKEISIRDLKNRIAAITVNSHLAYAVLRYMEKKDMETLTIDKAKTVVEKIDQNLVSDYHPLNWFEILKPVFALSGPAVDSNLLRLFFEEKGIQSAANTFDKLDKTIGETEFIEVMSSPGLPEAEEHTGNQQRLFEESTEEVESDYELDDEPGIKSVEIEEEETAVSTEPDDLNELFSTEPEDSYLDMEEEEALFDDETEKAVETEAEISEESEIEDLPAEDVTEEEPEKEDVDDGSLNRLFAKNEPDDDEEEQDAVETAPFEPDEEIAESDEDEKTVKPSSDKGIATDSDTIEESIQPDREASEDENDQIQESLESAPEDDINNEDEEIPLLNRFIFDDSQDEEDEEESRSRDTIYSELNLVKEDREEITLRDLFSQEPEEGEDEPEEETEYWAKEHVDEEEEDEDTSEDSRTGYWANNVFDEEEDMDEESEPENDISTPVAADEDDNVDEDETDEAGDVPMWRSFLEREDADNEPGFQFDEDSEEEVLDDEELDEDGFIEEPIFDLTKDESDEQEQISRIAKWLMDEEDTFIEEIFGNSETEYEQALAEIENFEDWKKASKFIEREIFSRNRIDIYDEIAVDFTDRLHTYFLEFKS